MRLALEPDIVVVGEASDAREALALAKALQPQVIVMDVVMPGLDGLAATTALRALVPRSAVVILSLHDDAANRAAAKRAGARAFVAKQGDIQELLAAIRG